MPLYEYQCEKCGRFELIHKFSDPPLTACPTCGRPVQKLPSSPAIQFKGTGWYITDYARKGDGKKDADKDSGPKESGAKESSSTDKASSSKGSGAAGGSSSGSGSASGSGPSSGS